MDSFLCIHGQGLGRFIVQFCTSQREHDKSKLEVFSAAGFTFCCQKEFGPGEKEGKKKEEMRSRRRKWESQASILSIVRKH